METRAFAIFLIFVVKVASLTGSGINGNFELSLTGFGELEVASLTGSGINGNPPVPGITPSQCIVASLTGSGINGNLSHSIPQLASIVEVASLTGSGINGNTRFNQGCF